MDLLTIILVALAVWGFLSLLVCLGAIIANRRDEP